ncbi:MAG: GNAT family N-acetyltransferase [Thermoplasmata archaeon]
MDIKIRKLGKKYLNDAAEITWNTYIREKEAVPCLPMKQDYRDEFRERLTDLFTEGTGVVAISDNRLVGFLGGYEVKELLGTRTGVYCPVYGHGAPCSNREYVYQKMYMHAAELWVKKEMFDHLVTVYAHDEEVVDTWFWMGFGLRGVDAICEVSVNHEKNFDIVKADMDDISGLAELHRKHNLYYRNSPIFMPSKDEDPIKDLGDWLKNKDHHLWMAYNDEKPLGYIRIQPSGESLFSRHPDMMNITGAYVDESYRRSGIGRELLNEVQRWLQEYGYSLLGVDFESINPTGSNFWRKYFTPYTYSLSRCIWG